MITEQVIQTLQLTLNKVTPESPNRFFRIADQIKQAKESVVAQYSQIFSPENIDKMTKVDFRSFLLFKNNRHWDSLHRQGGRMTADMPKLREAIKLLVDESLSVKVRLDKLRPSTGNPMVKGLGRAVITAILQIMHPEKYGVLNNTAEAGMKQLGLWPKTRRGASFGERYEKINHVITETAAKLNIDLWTLDMLWWRVANSHVPNGSDSGTGSDETTTTLDETEMPEGAIFGLERHLQDFLVDNWDSTDLGNEWQLLEEDGDVVGVYYNTREVGEIDLLAKHRKKNTWLVIELKRNQTSDSTVGQILRYMAWVRRKLASDGDTVKGLIVCRNIDRKLLYALDGQPNIECKTYEVSFTLRPIPELTQHPVISRIDN